jgi:hypothetical protein
MAEENDTFVVTEKKSSFSNYKEKVVKWWNYYEEVIIFFTIDFIPYILIGFILSIQLGLLIQIVIALIWLFIYYSNSLDNYSDHRHGFNGAINIITTFIVIGLLIGNITYYFIWYNGSIDWVNPFVPIK